MILKKRPKVPQKKKKEKKIGTLYSITSLQQLL